MANDIERMKSALHGIFMGMHLMYFPANRHSKKESARNYSLIELFILRNLAVRDGKMELKEIRSRLNLPNSTLSSMIKRLEKVGVITKACHEEDHRSFILQLTRFGAEIDRQHDDMDTEIAKNFIARLGGPEKVELFIELASKATREPMISLDYVKALKEIDKKKLLDEDD